MLLWLADLLGSHIRAFNVFNYTTLRAVMAALTALTISLLLGPWVIRKLTELKVGQAVRSDGPQTHLVKAGTPTMGGSLILLAITLTTLLWADLSNKYVWLLLAVMLGTGALGFYDDWRKVVYKDPKGVSAKFKMAWQSAIAIGAGVFLIATAKLPASTEFI
ncbi:phospho-N-acetylmuramoyl-pentapeptide-transferase, partial [Pseudomonas sp. MWU13-2860]